MVPFMRLQLQADEPISHKSTHRKPSISDVEKKFAAQSTPRFKQSFCVCAQDLADELHIPLHQLGTLYNDMMTTATKASRLQLKQTLPIVGKGQLMFTIRHLNRDEANHFAASGYGFAPINRINNTLAQRTHMSAEELQAHLCEMRDYDSTEGQFTPGVHLVAFALRPTMHSHFEVLTTKAKGSNLPSCTLPIRSLNAADLEVISTMNEWTVNTCLKWLRPGGTDSVVDVFRDYLFKALLELSSSLPQDLISGARFSSRVLSAPCRRPYSSLELVEDVEKRQADSQTQTCTLLSVRVIVPLGTRLSDPHLRFVPLRLFRVEEQVNDGSGDRNSFIREFNDEFSYCVQTAASKPATNPPSKNSIVNKTVLTRISLKDNRKSYNLLSFWSLRKNGGFPFSKQHPNHPRTRTRGLNSQESLVEMTPQTTNATTMMIKNTSGVTGNGSSSGSGSGGIGDIVISKEVRVKVAQLDTTNVVRNPDHHRPSPSISSRPPLPPSPTTVGSSANSSRIFRVSTSDIPAVPSLDSSAFGNGNENNKSNSNSHSNHNENKPNTVSFSQNYVDGLYSMCFSPGIRMKPSQFEVAM
jgi:hypothetical protein